MKIINLKDRIENTHLSVKCDECVYFIPRHMKEYWVSDVVLDILFGGVTLFILDKFFGCFIQIGINIL